MKYLYELLNFICLGFILHVDGGSGGGDPAGGAAGVGANGSPAGGAAGAGTGAAGTPAAGTPPAGGTGSAAAPAAGNDPLITADGKFGPGFAKQYPELAKKFSDPSSLLKSHVNLESMIGKQDRVPVPGPHSTPEEIALFRQKMGVPTKPEEYGILKPKELDGKPLPDGLWDDTVMNGYMAKFHELGIPKAQAQALVEYGLKEGMGRVQSLSEIVTQTKADGEKQLKADWGDRYKENLISAERGAAASGLTAEMIANDPMLANNPTFLRAMARIGAMVKETPAAATRGATQTISDPQTRINELQAKMAHPAYKRSADFAHHQEYMSEMRDLISQKENTRR
jgi:hypothetical protein